MNKDYKPDIPERFIEEKLAEHWRVNESRESFKKLINHIEKITNFRSYFEQAINHIPWKRLSEDLVFADVGSGVGWTSAILAMNPKVKKVYSIEPGIERGNRIKHVVNHFNVNNNKVEWIRGSFEDFKLPEKVDYTILCASFHHCVDSLQQNLFETINNNSKHAKAGILIANEHYMTPFWTIKQILLYYLKHSSESRSKLHWGPGKWRAPSPWDNEHHRTKRECDEIFKDNGFKTNYYVHSGDLCKNKKYKWETRLAWRYYHALLERIET